MITSEKIKEMTDNEFLGWLVHQLAPTITGSKPATILTLKDLRGRKLLTQWREQGQFHFTNSHIAFRILRQTSECEVIFFYYPEVMERCIRKKKNSWFLRGQGYPVQLGVEACLDVLSERYRSCCPHEMGILLGIPLQDVLGFMSASDLPLVCRGEWCVYGKPDRSLKIMQQFRRDRDRVYGLLSHGIAPQRLICGQRSEWGEMGVCNN